MLGSLCAESERESERVREKRESKCMYNCKEE